MTDIVNKETRSKMMSGIKGKNTKPELIIRKELFKRGYRYRLHEKKLSGKPDIVLKKYNAVIFVNGCFWHKHNCHLFKWPKTNTEFWVNKISLNEKKDEKNFKKLLDEGWRIATIWECSLKGKNRLDIKIIIDRIIEWLKSSGVTLEISGEDES